VPSHGAVDKVDIPATTSGFKARKALVYLPPAALVPTKAKPALPVILMLSGQPGCPNRVFNAGGIQTMMDDYAQHHQGLAPIVIAADQLGADSHNTLCVDSQVYGNALTYLTQDVVDWVKDNLPAAQDAKDWAIAGFSQGATVRGVNHPDLFGTMIPTDSEIKPTNGSRQEMIDRFFDGDTTAYENQVPVNAIRNHAPPSDAHHRRGEKDTTSIRNVKTIAPVAAKPACASPPSNRPATHTTGTPCRTCCVTGSPYSATTPDWMVRTRTYPTIRISNASRYDDPEHKPASLRIPERKEMTQTQTAPKPAEASPAKPLFGARAARRSAGWIRRHLLTVCLVLFVILINGHADRVRAHTSAVPAEPGQSKFRSARTRSLVHRADIHAGRTNLAVCSSTFTHAGCVRPGRIGDRQNQNRMVSVITTLGGVAGQGQFSIRRAQPQWHAISHDGAILGPLILVAGTLMCASAFTTMLWRRRIRVIGYAVVLIMSSPRQVSDYLPACHFGDWPRARLSDGLRTHGDEYGMAPSTKCVGLSASSPACRPSARWWPYRHANPSDCCRCSAC
ncbi:MAG: alpha/beta hydrolase, partial [Bifidobacterium dentium]